MDIYKILLLFMIYSFIGWCWETTYVSIKQRKYINRGFLHGPFIPIYAFGAIAIIASLIPLENMMPSSSFLRFLTIFLYTALLCSFLEYVTSYILEIAFKTRWWDYSEKKYNLKGRICLLYSLGWGLAGYVNQQFLYPLIIERIYNLPKSIGVNILIAFMTYFIIDFLVTLRDLVSLKKLMSDMLTISGELKDKFIYSIDNIIESIEMKQNKLKEDIFYIKANKESVLSEKQHGLIRRFNSLLEKSKNYKRFYNKYPKAKSIHFQEFIDVIKRKN